jgi:S-adenosyl-L-methionine hydrolase (adenosine-forming)
MPKPIVTLTTDFGLADHFVGTMKGVILGIAPDARIVDISHDVTPFDIAQDGLLLAQAWKYFPRGTVHVVVVDPGVGSARRPILMEAAGHRFVAPDNGVLSMVYSREKHTVRAITAQQYFLQPVSRTFHGRDVFAPVAAHLARGARPASFGPRIDDYLRQDFARPAPASERAWTGTVLHIDRFGNLITNFRLEEFPQLRERRFTLAVGRRAIKRLVGTYAECRRGELVLLEGSSGFLEISLDRAPAAAALGCGAGAPLKLTVY